MFKSNSPWFIPIELFAFQNQLLIRWIDRHTTTFTEPFFHQTVQTLRATQASEKLTSLNQLQLIPPTLPPTAFIFHTSRCGSTLLSQMLAALPKHLVISEATPINQALRMPEISGLQSNSLLKLLINALGSNNGEQTRYFIKFSSWNSLYLATLRELYPTVPILFLYRDPLEVLVSLIQSPARWLQSHKSPILQTLIAQATSSPTTQLECYGAAIHSLLHQGLRNADDRMLFINYRDLLSIVFSHILPFLGIELTDCEKKQMESTTQFYAKDRHRIQSFNSDIQQKQAVVTEAMRQVDRQYTRHLYDFLETHPRNVNLV